MISRAQELIDALVTTRETLEKQETDGEASLEAVRSCVATLHQSRTRFLNTARTRLDLDALSEDTEDQIEALTEQAFSPSHLPRPYLAAGVRLPEERR
jgi:proline dehydrogenase